MLLIGEPWKMQGMRNVKCLEVKYESYLKRRENALDGYQTSLTLFYYTGLFNISTESSYIDSWCSITAFMVP